MKLLEHFLGVLCAFCLMIIFLITSVEAVAYWTPGYYEHEYSKYNVTEAVRMEMDDLLEVTDEMMAYLRGDREDLHVDTIVNGEPREFFNAREIAHMEDVRGLFIGALMAGTGLFFLITAGLAALISTDFTKYFVIFHHIFFDNDLWLLDARTDLLINIVPEPFFMDTAARIGITFAGMTALLFAVCAILIKREHKQK